MLHLETVAEQPLHAVEDIPLPDNSEPPPPTANGKTLRTTDDGALQVGAEKPLEVLDEKKQPRVPTDIPLRVIIEKPSHETNGVPLLEINQQPLPTITNQPLPAKQPLSAKQSLTELPRKRSPVEESASIRNCFADSEFAMDLSPKQDRAMERHPNSPTIARPPADGCEVWHTSEPMSAIQENNANDVVIGFEGFQVDPESKHKAWLMTMDYVQKFDIELDKEIYYAGELVSGRVIVITTENIKVKGIRLTLRGKAHTEWKINKAGETRTLKDDEYYIDDKRVLWGKDKNEDIAITPILPRGQHTYSFEFKLPETALPCSFESKIGHVRYYLRVVMDIPYASPPQGIKYFTIIGPHIDCMEDKYLSPKYADDKYRTCCFCCVRGLVRIQATLERSAYCCGEHIRVKAEIQNGNDEPVYLLCKFVQYVEYYMDKGVLGIMKSLSHTVWEYQTETVRSNHVQKQDKLQDDLQVPVVPPTLIDVCGLIQIHYMLKLYVVGESSGQMMHVQFPITIGTVPFRIPSMPSPQMMYEIAADYVEGGKYISSEFQLGQVYMGDEFQDHDEVILYRPVYSCVPHEKIAVTNTKRGAQSRDPADGQPEGAEAVCEEINVLPVRKKSQKSLDKKDSAKFGDRLKPEVVTVDEVSSSEPWEVIALKK